jgi:hypothetical protein
MSAEPTHAPTSTPAPIDMRALRDIADDGTRPLRRIGAVLAILLAANAAALGYLALVASKPVFPAAQVAAAERWEYMSAFHRDSETPGLTAWMNTNGEAGWEAYNVRRANGSDDPRSSDWGTEVMFRRRRISTARE